MLTGALQVTIAETSRAGTSYLCAKLRTLSERQTMTKKITLMALAAISAAMLAVPALASAQTAHLDVTSTFTVTGGAWTLATTSGTTTAGTSVSGSGTFTTTTTGTIDLTLSGFADEIFGTKCGSTLTGHAENSGIVTAKGLSFHLIMLATNKPGILITPSATEIIAKYKCLGIETALTGKGLLGTITAPACGVASTTATLKIRSSSNGHQEHKLYTGVSYDLDTGPNANQTASINVPGDMVLHFPAARKIECTHTT
jgi:hypothetical protein